MIVVAQATLNVPLATRKIFIHALLYSVRHWAQLNLSAPDGLQAGLAAGFHCVWDDQVGCDFQL
jgi:hypothetical protein